MAKRDLSWRMFCVHLNMCILLFGVECSVFLRSDVSQTGKGKYHMISLICEIQKTKQMNKRIKTEIDSERMNCWLSEGREGGKLAK